MRTRFALGALLALLAGCGGDLQPRSESTPTPTVEPPPSPAEVSRRDEAFARKAALSPDGDARRDALALLDEVLRSEASVPTNAWALAHGLLAYGRTFQASDGRLAAEVLAADFLEREAGRVGFPQRRGDLRVEPHTDLIVKSLLEAGWGLDEPLPGATPPVTPRDLVNSSRARLKPLVPSEEAGGGGPRFRDPNDAPWTMDAWCAAARAESPPEPAWTTADGVAVTLDGLAKAQFGVLETETWFLRQAKEAGLPVEKKKQGVFRYTCGGSHLFQGVASCVRAGLPAGPSASRLAKQVELYLHRIDVETKVIDRTLMQAPQFRSILYNQDVKFLGHLLEALGKVERDGLWTPTPADRSLLDMAETRLIFHILQQKKIGTYRPEALAKLRAADDKSSQDPLQGFQFYLDLVGDAAHAKHGLDIQAALRANRGG